MGGIRFHIGPVVALLLGILGAIFSFWSCDRTVEPNDERLIAVEISNFDTYQYKTGISGDEERAFISEQAKHYEVSEIVRNSTTQWEAVYRYKSEEDYVGTDHVEIETHRGSDGASPPTEIELIMIEFTVTD